MRYSLTRPDAPRPRFGTLALFVSGPGPRSRFVGVLLTAVASCCLAAALSRDSTISGVPGADDTGPQAPPDRELHNLCAAAEQRAAEKFALAGEVIDGRLALLPAAARFRDLNARPPAFSWEAFRRTYPGSSDDERHCREVIQYVRQEVQRRPGVDATIPGRLEAELRCLLERGGCRLPGSDDIRPGDE